MTDYKIMQAMTIYGGSFVKALGFAALHADSINLAKLKTAFPEYWDEYQKIATAMDIKS